MKLNFGFMKYFIITNVCTLTQFDRHTTVKMEIQFTMHLNSIAQFDSENGNPTHNAAKMEIWFMRQNIEIKFG